MDTETYSNEHVKGVLSGWVVRRVNVSTQREVATRYGVVAIPLALVLAADGREIERVPDFVPPDELVRRLQAVPTK